MRRITIALVVVALGAIAGCTALEDFSYQFTTDDMNSTPADLRPAIVDGDELSDGGNLDAN